MALQDSVEFLDSAELAAFPGSVGSRAFQGTRAPQDSVVSAAIQGFQAPQGFQGLAAFPVCQDFRVPVVFQEFLALVEQAGFQEFQVFLVFQVIVALAVFLGFLASQASAAQAYRALAVHQASAGFQVLRQQM